MPLDLPGARRATVLLDARCVTPPRLDGVGRFWWELLPPLVDACDAADLRLVLLTRPGDRDAFLARTCERAGVVALDVPIASVAQQITWPRAVAAVAPDVVHYPQFDMPFVPAGVVPVATVYDTTVVDEPDYFRTPAHRLAAAALFSSTCARARRITTLAGRAADGIAARARVPRTKLAVVPPGVPSPPPALLVRAREPRRIAYVGNNRPHKRVPLLVRAFARVRARFPDAELVLVQRPDPRFPLALDGADGVRLVADADDATALSWVSSARALAFPSVGEGFGFPVLEAFSVGTPVVVADAAALPEVAGAGGLVVPADDEAALAAALERVLVDDNLHARLTAGAAAEVSARSWDAAAAALVEVWREALPTGHDAARSPWESAR